MAASTVILRGSQVLAPQDDGLRFRDPPHAQTLVAPAAAGLQAILIYEFNRTTISPFVKMAART